MSESTFWTMDHVANSGVELEIRGKKWTFRALTFRDEAAIITKRKSVALQAFMEADAVAESPAPFQEQMAQRQMDLSTIAYGSKAQTIDLSDRITQVEVCRRSLLTSHPDLTDQQVVMILAHFDKSLITSGPDGKTKPSKEWHPDRETVLEVISLWTYGPPDSAASGKNGEADAGA